MSIEIKTWMYEAVVVFLVLGSVAYLSGNDLAERIVCFAILMTFMHAQVADRMQEKQAQMPSPDVSCWRWSNRYYIAKESLWILFFLVTGTYTAIVGSALFLLYPLWRKWYRK